MKTLRRAIRQKLVEMITDELWKIEDKRLISIAAEVHPSNFLNLKDDDFVEDEPEIVR